MCVYHTLDTCRPEKDDHDDNGDDGHDHGRQICGRESSENIAMSLPLPHNPTATNFISSAIESNYAKRQRYFTFSRTTKKIQR